MDWVVVVYETRVAWVGRRGGRVAFGARQHSQVPKKGCTQQTNIPTQKHTHVHIHKHGTSKKRRTVGLRARGEAKVAGALVRPAKLLRWSVGWLIRSGQTRRRGGSIGCCIGWARLRGVWDPLGYMRSYATHHYGAQNALQRLVAPGFQDTEPAAAGGGVLEALFVWVYINMCMHASAFWVIGLVIKMAGVCYM